MVTAEPITDVDTTAADMVADLDERLDARGISLVLAEAKDLVREKIDRYELTRAIRADHIFPTIEEAVEAYRKQTGATWTSEKPGTARPDQSD